MGLGVKIRAHAKSLSDVAQASGVHPFGAAGMIKCYTPGCRT